MKPGMKMLLVANNRDMESKTRDRRGREHYESGRYAPRSNYDMEDNYPMTDNYDEMESRRRRDSRGRFMRSDWDGDIYWTGDINEPDRTQVTSRYPGSPFPVYRNTPEMRGDLMNQIGFVAEGPEIRRDYGMNIDHPMRSEMEHHTSPRMTGGAASYMSMPMTKEMADEWTRGMKNEDGTKGPHWTLDQVKQVMAQKGIDCDPLEMFAVMNALYSDYCAVLKKHGANHMDMYTDLACAWLNDKDAVKNKASAYYEHIVKK